MDGQIGSDTSVKVSVKRFENELSIPSNILLFLPGVKGCCVLPDCDYVFPFIKDVTYLILVFLYHQ